MPVDSDVLVGVVTTTIESFQLIDSLLFNLVREEEGERWQNVCVCVCV